LRRSTAKNMPLNAAGPNRNSRDRKRRTATGPLCATFPARRPYT